MRLLIDANIVLDVLQKREPRYNRRQMSPASKFTKAAGSIFERQWWT